MSDKHIAMLVVVFMFTIVGAWTTGWYLAKLFFK